MENKVKDIMKNMRKDTLNGMNISYNRLCEILEPINATKLTYTEKRKFLESNGFLDAWRYIKKIVEAHQWLYSNQEKKDD